MKTKRSLVAIMVVSAGFVCAAGFSVVLASAGAADDDHGTHDAATDAERAICHVCRVHEGETEAEAVVATAEYDGHTHGFCSTACRDTFLEAPASYLPPVFPRPAPDFVMLGLDGAEVSSDAFRGKVMLLDFWATWCPPCVADLPKLTRLNERYAEEGLVIVSLSIDEGDTAARKVERMVKRRKARHPVFLDATDTPAWTAYGVRVVPSQYLIDADGRIVAQWSGKIDLAIVEAEIARVLGREAG